MAINKKNQIVLKDINKMKFAMRTEPAMAFVAYKNAVKLSAILIRTEMKHIVPKKTRNLARSIQSDVQGLEATIGPDIRTAPYAIFVHEGTRAHIIRPNKKKALFWKGAKHPVRMVRHPGTPANKFIDKTLKASQSKVHTVFKLTTAKLLRDIAKRGNVI